MCVCVFVCVWGELKMEMCVEGRGGGLDWAGFGCVCVCGRICVPCGYVCASVPARVHGAPDNYIYVCMYIYMYMCMYICTPARVHEVDLHRVVLMHIVALAADGTH